MRRLVSILFALFMIIEANAEQLKGVVLDENRETLPYATVRVKHKTTVAVLSDSLGIFTFRDGAVGKQDTLTISYVGYTTKTLPLATINPGDTLQVQMTPSKAALPEIAVVSNKKLKRKIKGKQHSSGMVRANLDKSSIGDCVGYEFHAKGDKKLILNKVGMIFCDGDSMATHLRFRINVYDMSKVRKEPTRNFVNVLDKPIYFDFMLTDPNDRKIEYTLPDPIVLPKDAMVEVELVDLIDGSKIWFKSNIIGKKTWSRELKYNFWYKDPFAMPFFVECLEMDKK